MEDSKCISDLYLTNLVILSELNDVIYYTVQGFWVNETLVTEGEKMELLSALTKHAETGCLQVESLLTTMQWGSYWRVSSAFFFKWLTKSRKQNEMPKIILKSKQAIGVHMFFIMHSYYLLFSLIRGCVALQWKIMAQCTVIIET